MCPSYRATLNERDTTRARANALREFLTNSDKVNKFDHEELKQVFDLCLSCKACASECPSSVDVASLKAEFEYQYQIANGISRRSKFFANATKYNKIASRVPVLANFAMQNQLISRIIKGIYGISKKRSLPLISRTSFSQKSVFVFGYLKFRRWRLRSFWASPSALSRPLTSYESRWSMPPAPLAPFRDIPQRCHAPSPMP